MKRFAGLALVAFTACGTSSSTGTTGGSCSTEAQSCTGLVSCCSGLSCSPALGICLTSPGSSGSPSGTATATTATTTSGTTASHTSTTGGLAGASTTGGGTGTHSGTTSGFAGTPSSTTSGFTGTVSSTTSGFSGTVSSTTSGFAGTVSSTTSGSSGYAGGCDPTSYFSTEYAACTVGGTTCGCGQTCATDTNTVLQAVQGGTTFCESPCQSLADCPDVASFCSGGFCRYNTCATPDAFCTGGFCQPYDYGTEELDVCTVGGNVQHGGVCEGSTFANAPSGNCVNGQICVLAASGDATGNCFTSCNATAPATACGANATCEGLDTTFADIGYCVDGGVVDAGPAAGTDGGYAGGCDVTTYFTTELISCDAGAACGCGQVCTAESNTQLQTAAGANVFCETPCHTTADCPDPDTACNGGYCRYNVCASPDATCSGGYCQPFDLANGELDLCAIGGTAQSDGVCQTAFTSDPSALCANGLLCLLAVEGDLTGNCFASCNPTAPGTTCGTGICESLDTSVTDEGYCSDGGF